MGLQRVLYVLLIMLTFTLASPMFQEGTYVDLSVSSFNNELNVSVFYKDILVVYDESGKIVKVEDNSTYLKNAIVSIYFVDEKGEKKPLPGCSNLITNLKRLKKIDIMTKTGSAYKIIDEFYATCHFTPPNSEGCIQIWAEFDGRVDNSKEVYPPSSASALFCKGKSKVIDILPGVLNQFLLHQFSNPSPGCFPALVIIGLVMTAFYYRYKTTFGSVLDLTRPRTPMPGEMKYSYTGVGMHGVGKEGPKGIIKSLENKWKKALKNKKFILWAARLGVSRARLRSLFNSNKMALGALVELYERGVSHRIVRQRLNRLLSKNTGDIVSAMREMHADAFEAIRVYAASNQVLSTYGQIYQKGEIAKRVFKVIDKMKRVPVLKPLTVPLNRFATGVHRTFKLNARLFKEALVLPPLLRRKQSFWNFVARAKRKGGGLGFLAKAAESFVGHEPAVGKLFLIDKFFEGGVQTKRLEEALERNLLALGLKPFLENVKDPETGEKINMIELLSPEKVANLYEAENFKNNLERAMMDLEGRDTGTYKEYIEKLRNIIQSDVTVAEKANMMKSVLEELSRTEDIDVSNEIKYLDAFNTTFSMAYQQYQDYLNAEYGGDRSKDSYQDVLFTFLMAAVNAFDRVAREHLPGLPFYIGRQFEHLSHSEKVLQGITNEFYNLNKNKEMVKQIKEYQRSRGKEEVGPGFKDAFGLFALKEIAAAYGYVSPENVDYAYGKVKEKKWAEVLSEEGREGLKKMMEAVRDILVRKILLDESKFADIEGIIDPVYLFNRYALANYALPEAEEAVERAKGTPDEAIMQQKLERLKELVEQVRSFGTMREEFKEYARAEALYDYIGREDSNPYIVGESIEKVGFMIPVVGKTGIEAARDNPVSRYFRANGLDIGIALAKVGITGSEDIEGFPRNFYEFSSLGNLLVEKTGVREIPVGLPPDELKNTIKNIVTSNREIKKLKGIPLGERFLGLLGTDLSQTKLKGILTLYSNFTLGEASQNYLTVNNMLQSFRLYVARKRAKEKGTTVGEELESITMEDIKEFLSHDENRFITLKDLESDQLFMVNKDGDVIPFEDIILPSKKLIDFYVDTFYSALEKINGENLVKEKERTKEVLEKAYEEIAKYGSLRKWREAHEEDKTVIIPDTKEYDEILNSEWAVRELEQVLSGMGLTAGMWTVSVGYTPLNLDFKVVMDGKVTNMLEVERLAKKDLPKIIEALEEGTERLSNSDKKALKRILKSEKLTQSQKSELMNLLETKMGYNNKEAQTIVEFLSDKSRIKEEAERLAGAGFTLLMLLSGQVPDLSKINPQDKEAINLLLEKMLPGKTIDEVVNLFTKDQRSLTPNERSLRSSIIKALKKNKDLLSNLGKLPDIIKRGIKAKLSFLDAPQLLNNPKLLEPLLERLISDWKSLPTSDKMALARELTNFLFKEIRERRSGKPLLDDRQFDTLRRVANREIAWTPEVKKEIMEIQDKLIGRGREDIAFKIGRWLSDATSDFDLVLRVATGRKVFIGSTPQVRKSIIKRLVSNFKNDSFRESLVFAADTVGYLGFDLAKHFLYDIYARPLWEITGPEMMKMHYLQGDYARAWMHGILYKRSLLAKAKEGRLTKEDMKVLGALERFFTIAEWHQTREPGHITYNMVDRISRWAKLAATYHARMSQFHPAWLEDIYRNFKPYRHSNMGFGVMSRLLRAASYSAAVLGSKAQSRAVLMLRGLNKSFSYHTGVDIAYIKDEELLNKLAKEMAKRYGVDTTDERRINAIRSALETYLYIGHMRGPKHVYIYKHPIQEERKMFDEIEGIMRTLPYTREARGIPDVARGLSHVFQHGLGFVTSSFFTMAAGATWLSSTLGLGPIGGFAYLGASLLKPKWGWSFVERIETGVSTKGSSTVDIWQGKQGFVSKWLGKALGIGVGPFMGYEATGVADWFEKVDGFRPQAAFAGWYTGTLGAYHDIPGYMYYQYPTGLMGMEPWMFRQGIFERGFEGGFYSGHESAISYRFFQQHHVPLMERYLEGLKELSGFEPYYNYPYGFFSYALFLPWLGYLFNSLFVPLGMKVGGPISDAWNEAKGRSRYLSRARRFGFDKEMLPTQASSSRIGAITSAIVNSGVGKGIVGIAAAGTALAFGGISFGGLALGTQTFLVSRFLEKGNFTYCPVCGRKKPRGLPCPHCGYAPSSSMF